MSIPLASLRTVLYASSKRAVLTPSATRTLSTQSSSWTCRTPSSSLGLVSNPCRGSSYHKRNTSAPLVLRRTMGNPAAPQGTMSDIPMDAYQQVSDHTMEQLHDELEELIDMEGEPGWEVEYHSGVLTLNLGPRGTYVINKQPPNKQIWLSSPISGPKRYDITPGGEWTYLRDGIPLDTLLNNELSTIFEQDVDLELRIPEERLRVYHGKGNGGESS